MKDREARRTGFFNGLNGEMTNMVEMQHNVDLVDMIHLTTKTKKQLKLIGSTFQGGNSSLVFTWRPNYRRDSAITSKLNIVGNKI